MDQTMTRGTRSAERRIIAVKRPPYFRAVAVKSVQRHGSMGAKEVMASWHLRNIRSGVGSDLCSI